MKHLRIPALMFLTLLIGTCLAGAGAEPPSPAPFNGRGRTADFRGLATVGELRRRAFPHPLRLDVPGRRHRRNWLTLVSAAADGAELGEATIAVTAEDGAIGGAEDGESAALPDGLQGLEARLIGARWLSGDYALPVVRASRRARRRRTSSPHSSPTATNTPTTPCRTSTPTWTTPGRSAKTALIGGFSFEDEDGGVDYVYGWCTLDAPDEWREYDQLTYQTAGGFVREIELTYSTDPE